LEGRGIPSHQRCVGVERLSSLPEKLVEDLVADEEFVFGAYKTFQVSVSQIATSASLDLGGLVHADVLAGLDDAEALRPILTLDDIRI
jgi:hypothetical protein